MKRILTLGCFLCLISVLLSINIVAVDQNVYSWYCTRNKNNKQPLLNGKIAFVEQYNGYHVDHKHGDDCEEKIIYLTFDAGYENGNLKKILDVLDQENVPAAFFILGNLITTNTDLIKRMIKEGHTVCNHTYSHKDISKMTRDEFAKELKKLEDTYTQYTGEVMTKYFRPPEGKFSHANMEYANELGYKTIFWSFAYEDWDNNKQMSPEKAKEKILSNMHNGAIVLLHPNSSTNAMILGDIIKELKGQGYSFGTLDDLTAA